VRSASRHTVTGPAAVVGALAASAVLAGCATTQQEAARLQLNSARIRASQVVTRVTVPGHTVEVTRLALVRSGDGTAFVVAVHNPAGRSVSDLPISVGVQAGRRRIYVNAQPGTSEYSYFGAHLPVVASRSTVTWVYTTNRRLPRAARPFALVGDQPNPPVPSAAGLPVIRATLARGTPADRGRLAIALHNVSGVPQYQLQVYAVAETAGRYTAAGDFTVVHLGSQGSMTLDLGLLGTLGHSHLALEALPTIPQ